MRREFLIFGLVFVAVLALVLVWRGRPTIDVPTEDVRLLQVYSVPAERGEGIRDALRVVLMATREGGEPLGHASLPTPTQLLVSAPSSMQASVRRAVTQLSEGAAVAAPSPARAVALELWVVGSDPARTTDDPALQPVSAALDQARSTFGLARLALLDRSVVVGSSEGDHLSMETQTLRSVARLQNLDAETVQAHVEMRLLDDDGRQAMFSSALPLRAGEWQVVGLISARGTQAPDRVLLMRQTPIASAAPARAP